MAKKGTCVASPCGGCTIAANGNAAQHSCWQLDRTACPSSPVRPRSLVASQPQAIVRGVSRENGSSAAWACPYTQKRSSLQRHLRYAQRASARRAVCTKPRAYQDRWQARLAYRAGLARLPNPLRWHRSPSSHTTTGSSLESQPVAVESAITYERAPCKR